MKCIDKGNQKIIKSTRFSIYEVIICRKDGFGDNKFILFKLRNK